MTHCYQQPGGGPTHCVTITAPPPPEMTQVAKETPFPEEDCETDDWGHVSFYMCL